jgi:hypothetical protein
VGSHAERGNQNDCYYMEILQWKPCCPALLLLRWPG